jgi:oligopeptide/dipeptide ABC transporter ATP-binding protein
VNASTLLEIDDLHVQFETDDGLVRAVNGLSLKIKRGETLALVGESGCGKSVTSLAIVRLISYPGKIHKGKIFFEGQNLLHLDESQMQSIRGNEIAFVFQEPMTSLNPVYRIGRQISEVIRRHQKKSKAESESLAKEFIAKVGIPDPSRLMRGYPHQLSGGMRQRVMIAMALACQPKLIIADEPTTALDVTIQAQIIDLFNTLKKDIDASILLITHDLGVVSEMAETVVVMYSGSVVEYGSIDKIFDRPLHPYTLGLMKCIPSMDKPVPVDRKLETISGIVQSLIGEKTGCLFQERCEVASDKCQTEEPTIMELQKSHFVRCWKYS